MIDFRYHIVSLVAVFLALALGLVLGTTTINPVVVRDLQDRLDTVVADKRGLEEQLDTARNEAASGDAFARAAMEALVEDRLAGRSVVLVSLPGAPVPVRDQLARLLQVAGASVTARVSLTDRYVDPDSADQLDVTVTAATPSGVTLAGTTPAQRSAELLATVLTRDLVDEPAPEDPGTGEEPEPTDTTEPSPVGTPTPDEGATDGEEPVDPTASPTGDPTVDPEATATEDPTDGATTDPFSPTPDAEPTLDTRTAEVLEEFRREGFVEVEGSLTLPGELVVVLTAEGAAEGELPEGTDNDPLLDLVGAFATATAGNTVVAGPSSAADGGVVEAVRGSGIASVVSTVDAAETAYGLTATVLALRAQIDGVVGRYGTAPDDRPLPELPDL